MFILKQKKISWLTVFLAGSLLTFGCVDLQNIKWEDNSVDGTVLGTFEQPRQYGASTIKIAIRLDSGEMILVSPMKNYSTTKGQRLKLYRGTTNLGNKFYSLAPPSQYK